MTISHHLAKEGRTVWVIDDEPGVRQALQTRLHIEGYEVELFSDPQDLWAQDLTRPVACILLDLRLPLEDGLAVLRKLRDRGCEAPIIIISAHGDASTAVRALRDGAMDFFEKPFEIEVLLDRIRGLIQSRTTHGALTRLANRLAPHEARELFREIAPALVLAIFSHLQRAADVRVVARAADHLCRDDVQARIRKLEHVREGIVDELASFLRDEAILTNREMLIAALDSSDVAYRLLALEACLAHAGAA